MLKLKSFLAFVCLCVVGAGMFVGCGEKDRSADELIGVYELAQVKISYFGSAPGTEPTILDIGAEGNDAVMKSLSEIVYEEYHKYQYAVVKNADQFKFEARVLDEQTGKYATVEANAVSVSWDGTNELFSLQNGNYIHHISLYNGRFYYEAVRINLNDTPDYDNQEIKAFMQSNGMEQIMIKYGLKAD